MGQETLYSRSFSGVPATKGIAAVILAFFLLGVAVPSTRSIFTLVPGHTIPPHFYIWNLVTSGFCEISIINAIISLACLLVYGKFLETFWGSREYLKFILIVITFSGIASFFMMMIFFVFFRSEGLWFNPSLGGFSSGVAGFTIAIKQLIPDEQLIPGADILRGKHASLIFLVYGISFSFFKIIPLETMSFSVFWIANFLDLSSILSEER